MLNRPKILLRGNGSETNIRACVTDREIAGEHDE